MKVIQTLTKFGAEVIAIDQDKEKVEAVKDITSVSLILDSTDETAMKAANIEDVDAAVRYGFGFRFLAAGPLLQKDLSGVDIHCSAAEGIYPDLCNARRPSAYMTEMVAAGHTGVKAKKGFYDWTDEKIEAVKSRYEKTLLSTLEVIKTTNDSL